MELNQEQNLNQETESQKPGKINFKMAGFILFIIVFVGVWVAVFWQRKMGKQRVGEVYIGEAVDNLLDNGGFEGD